MKIFKIHNTKSTTRTDTTIENVQIIMRQIRQKIQMYIAENKPKIIFCYFVHSERWCSLNYCYLWDSWRYIQWYYIAKTENKIKMIITHRKKSSWDYLSFNEFILELKYSLPYI